MPKLMVESLTRVFPGGGGVRDLTFHVPDGTHAVIVGPSGAGKSTLLRLIAGLENPDRGRVVFDDRDVTLSPAHQRHVALISQRPAIYAHRTVRRNLTIGVELRDRTINQATDDKATEVADWLGLTPILNRAADELSGGEQQRVAIGRMVVTGHAIWLLDEPLIHLDPVARDEIRWQLHLIRQRLGPTIIEVTHDPADPAIGQQVIVLLGGQLAQVGPPAEVSARPNSRGVATSLGWPPMNFIEGPAAPNAGAGGSKCALGIRPEDVACGPAGPGDLDLGEWEFVRVDHMGPRSLWWLTQNGARLRRWAQREEAVSPVVRLHAKAGAVHRFDANTGLRLE